MCHRRVLLLVLLVLACVGAVDRAEAQTPVTNPTAVVFTPSADHATVTAYEFGYFAVGAASPTQAASIAKAALTPTGTDYQFAFPRLLFGSFVHKLRACAGTTCSPWVDADKSTVVTPFPPTVVRVQ